MSSVSWATVEDAIHAWVVASSGLDEDRVIWSYQGGVTPEYPFILLAIATSRPVGHDWVFHRDAQTPTPGHEIERVVRGHRVGILNLQCFGSSGVGAEPLVNPMQILENVMTGLGLYIDDLDAGGVGVGQVQPVNLIPGNRGGGLLDPRATSAVEIHLAAEVVGATQTYIQYIQLKTHVKNPAGTDLSVVETWVPEDPTP